MEAADDKLNPSDLWLRGLVLEAQQEYARANPLLDFAQERLYTPETREASQSQMDYVCARVKERRGLIVDLASGRAYLLDRLLASTRRHFLATDLSPRVLREDLARFRSLGFGSRVDALAFDALRTPFADGSLATMTTNLGLMNIDHPAGLLEELRRIVSGEILGITAFYPEDVGRNSETIHRLGLDLLYYRQSALSAFEHAGFSVVIANARKARALPTPESRFLAGFQPDLMPIEETELEWCTVIAR
ncbi:MAG: class I SAM-dependent methyltransferase [Thermoplasmata archaeon]